MKGRLGKFKLTLAEEKSGVHMFTRFRKRESKRFSFLGFEYRWGRSLKGNDMVRLNPKLRGYYNYFGVIGNWRGLRQFHDEVVRTLYQRLNRRSQKRSFNWKGLVAMMSYYGMEQPRITWGGEDQSCLNLA